MTKYFVSALGLVCLCACYVPIEMGRQMQADMRALREEIHETRRQGDAGVQAIGGRIALVESTLRQTQLSLDVLGKGTRTAGAGIGSQLEQVMRVIDELRGTVEVAEHRLTLAETKLVASEKARVEVEAAAALAAQARARDEAKKRASPKKAESLAEGTRLAKARDFSGARKVWRAVLDGAPKQAGSADEALIRIADSFYLEKNWEAALGEYVKLLDGFPKSLLAEQAFLQVGLCSQALGRKEDAVTFLTEVVKNYPKSERAKIARMKLAEMAGLAGAKSQPTSNPARAP